VLLLAKALLSAISSGTGFEWHVMRLPAFALSVSIVDRLMPFAGSDCFDGQSPNAWTDASE